MKNCRPRRANSPDHFFSGSSSSRIMRFALLELTGCSRVTPRPIFLLGLNISARLRGPSLAVRVTVGMREQAAEYGRGWASRVVMPSEACDISCHAPRHAREPTPTRALRSPMALQTPEMSRNKSKPTVEKCFATGCRLKRART